MARTHLDAQTQAYARYAMRAGAGIRFSGRIAMANGLTSGDDRHPFTAGVSAVQLRFTGSHVVSSARLSIHKYCEGENTRYSGTPAEHAPRSIPDFLRKTGVGDGAGWIHSRT